MSASAPPTIRIALVGLLGGLLSGLFGVGGGIVMVPLLALWLGLEQRRAVATSLVAIIPIAVAGLAGYAWGAAVDWSAGLILAVGGALGGQIGVWLLPKIPVRWLQGAFALVLGYSAFRLLLPAQEVAVSAGATSGELPWLLLILIGVAAGILAGLLGVGGGIITVPALVLVLDLSMDSARGTSLLVVLFTAITASITNVWNARADVRIGLIAGLIGAPAALLGSLLGQWVPERQAGWLFAALLIYAAVQLAIRASRRESAVNMGGGVDRLLWRRRHDSGSKR